MRAVISNTNLVRLVGIKCMPTQSRHVTTQDNTRHSPRRVCCQVAYEAPALVNKTTVLQYERKVYADRISDAKTELRMVYRWVRH